MSLGLDDIIACLRDARDARASSAINTLQDDDHARGFVALR